MSLINNWFKIVDYAFTLLWMITSQCGNADLIEIIFYAENNKHNRFRLNIMVSTPVALCLQINVVIQSIRPY